MSQHDCEPEWFAFWDIFCTDLRTLTPRLQKLIRRRHDLIDGDRLDAQRCVCNQATIARAGITLKRILNDSMRREPWAPALRIRRSPDRDDRNADGSRHVHGTGIIANVQLRSAEQF